MEKLNFQFAKEICKDRFISKPIMFLGVCIDQEALDFVNAEKKRSEFEILINEAKKHMGSDFIARVVPDDDCINYQIVSFDGKLLSSNRTLRGVMPAGGYEFFVFSLDSVPIKYDNLIADANDRYKPGDKILKKESRLFFAPPKKSLFVRS